MGRKSRFATPSAAEIWAVSKGCPARGSNQPITSATRGLVRFWMTASGVPSEVAVGLPLSAMSKAWHDLSDAALQAIILDQPAPIHPIAEQKEDEQNVQPIPLPLNSPNAPRIGDTVEFQTRAPQKPVDRTAALEALQALLTPDAAPLDEQAIVEILNRHMGQTIEASARSITEQARLELAEIAEEARGIVNAAPRTLRIDISGKVKDLPAAARHPLFDTLLLMAVVRKEDPHGLVPALIGPAGSGKTTACEHMAAALDLPFYTLGALTGSHELLGYKDAAGVYHTTPFRQAFEHGGVFLLDEMDRSDPSVPVTLNSAIANGFAGFPDRPDPVRAHKDFLPLVAANTYGRGADRLYVGANQLDGSTLDRLAILTWDYDEVLERSLARDDTWTAYVQAARAAACDLKIRHIISPRASMGGASLRRAGMNFDLVAEAVLWKGLDQDQRSRITAKIPDSVSRRAQAFQISRAA